MPSSELFSCPVCGYGELTTPPYDEFKCAIFEICPSCGTEFGYDDVSTSFVLLRKNWIEKGMPWFSRITPKPTSWDPVEQMKNVGLSEN